MINMMFLYFIDVSLTSITYFFCLLCLCGVVCVMVVNHLSKRLSKKKILNLQYFLRVNWNMKYKKMTALCLSQLFMEGSRFREFKKMEISIKDSARQEEGNRSKKMLHHVLAQCLIEHLLWCCRITTIHCYASLGISCVVLEMTLILIIIIALVKRNISQMFQERFQYTRQWHS